MLEGRVPGVVSGMVASTLPASALATSSVVARSSTSPIALTPVPSTLWVLPAPWAAQRPASAGAASAITSDGAVVPRFGQGVVAGVALSKLPLWTDGRVPSAAPTVRPYRASSKALVASSVISRADRSVGVAPQEGVGVVASFADGHVPPDALATGWAASQGVSPDGVDGTEPDQGVSMVARTSTDVMPVMGALAATPASVSGAKPSTLWGQTPANALALMGTKRAGVRPDGAEGIVPTSTSVVAEALEAEGRSARAAASVGVGEAEGVVPLATSARLTGFAVARAPLEAVGRNTLFSTGVAMVLAQTSKAPLVLRSPVALPAWAGLPMGVAALHPDGALAYAPGEAAASVASSAGGRVALSASSLVPGLGAPQDEPMQASARTPMVAMAHMGALRDGRVPKEGETTPVAAAGAASWVVAPSGVPVEREGEVLASSLAQSVVASAMVDVPALRPSQTLPASAGREPAVATALMADHSEPTVWVEAGSSWARMAPVAPVAYAPPARPQASYATTAAQAPAGLAVASIAPAAKASLHATPAELASVVVASVRSVEGAVVSQQAQAGLVVVGPIQEVVVARVQGARSSLVGTASTSPVPLGVPTMGVMGVPAPSSEVYTWANDLLAAPVPLEVAENHPPMPGL